MNQFFDIAKYVLGVLLPVIGASVGTVLAFYFGQVNFEAASRSAANLVRQLTPREKLQAKAADQAMMKINEVTTFKIPTNKTEADFKIRDLIKGGFEKDQSHPRQRLPFLDAESRGNMCSTEAQSTHLWHLKNVLRTWTNQRCHSKIC